MVIDFHTHVFPGWLNEEREKYVSRDATFGELFANPSAKLAMATALIGEMDADGVDGSVVMGIGGNHPGLARAGSA